VGNDRPEDIPIVPHVRCAQCGTVTVRWGKLGWLFILALAASLSTAGVTAYRVNAGEAEQETIQKNIQTLNNNLGKIDEQVRISVARDKLLSEQMQLLLEAAQVTEHPEMPEVEASTLEELEP